MSDDEAPHPLTDGNAAAALAVTSVGLSVLGLAHSASLIWAVTSDSLCIGAIIWIYWRAIKATISTRSFNNVLFIPSIFIIITLLVSPFTLAPSSDENKSKKPENLPLSTPNHPSDQAPPALPAVDPNMVVSPQRRQPSSSDFRLQLVSNPTVGLGGEWTLALQNLSSPISPVSCTVTVPNSLAAYVTVAESQCDSIRLKASATPVPRYVDGRETASKPTFFSPIVHLHFPSGSGILLTQVSGVDALSLNNSTTVVLGEGSNAKLTLNAPLKLYIQFPSSPIPAQYSCVWSDTLDAEFNVRRLPISANGCAYEITLVNGPKTRSWFRDMAIVGNDGALGPLMQQLVTKMGASLKLQVELQGDVYSERLFHFEIAAQ